MGVEFPHETGQKKAQSAIALCKKNINNLHVELGYSSKVISHFTAETIGIQVTGTFKPCEDCTLGKAKKSRESKKTLLARKFWEEGFSLT